MASLMEAIDIKRKTFFEHEGAPYVCIDVEVSKPTARGGQTLVRLKMRNLLTRAVFDKTFKAGDKFAEPDLSMSVATFLYSDGDGYHFMDGNSYEQFALAADDIGDVAGYLKEGLAGVRSVVVNEKVISIELPHIIALRVEQTDPAIKGATAQAQTKPATLETGLVIQVPSYLESGELIQVDTREARFVSRAKE